MYSAYSIRLHVLRTLLTCSKEKREKGKGGKNILWCVSTVCIFVTICCEVTIISEVVS